MSRIIDGVQMNVIGTRVRKLRKELNISQQELSNRLELMAIYICSGSISRIEDLSRTVTDIEMFGMAKALGVSVEELYDKELLSKYDIAE